MANLVNREAVQKLCAASYLDDYLDLMQNLPHTLQPHLSRIRELDVEASRLMNKIEHLKSELAAAKNAKSGKEASESSLSYNGDDGDDSDAKRTATKNEALRKNLANAMEELGDVVQQKLAAAHKMAEIVECRRRGLDESLDNLHNCDQADSSLFSPGLSPNLPRSRSGQVEKRSSPLRGASGGSSTSPSASASDNHNNGCTKDNNESEESVDSGAEQDAQQGSDVESSTRSPMHTDSNSDGDDKGSDDTGTDGAHRATDSSRRGRIGRPPRSRSEATNAGRKAKQPDRGKASLVSSAGRSKLDRRVRNADSQSRSARSSGRGGDNVTTSKRQKHDSFSEIQAATSSKAGAGSQSRGAASNNKGGSSQRGNRGGNNNNNGGSSSASLVADVPDSMDQEVDEQLYCICKQVSYGEMVGCDNDNCPMQWFHFSCVNLTTKPKGRWFCPNCRGDKPNVKRADLR